MSNRLALSARRNHITQKVKIARQRTLYISVHNDAQPAEVFLRVKSPDCSSKLIDLYNVVARLMSIALQYGAPLERLGAKPQWSAARRKSADAPPIGQIHRAGSGGRTAC